ncbi:MAG: PQQ-dependent sugar dehydrogenase [Haloarculaceae archaeon]
MKRRQFLAAASLTGLAGCGRPIDESAESPLPGTPDEVGLETLASGLSGPLDVAFTPDGDRRYVAEQGGLVRVHESDGLRSTPLLDLQDTVVTGFEQGLLGIVLHPDFAENRRLFVRYSAPSRAGTPDGYSHTFVLSEFRVSEDGRAVEEDSERTIMEIPQPQANHNAGSIVFGPDGLLFVGVGDGGAGGDQGRGHVEDWYDGVAGGNGQDVTENLLGSVLRIDVDADEAEGYAVPEDNPLVGRDGLDEHYAWGLRNPWRLAFDGETLYAGDVGQNRYEELDRIEKGGNYGWNAKEGTHCYESDSCPDSTPDSVRRGERLRDPVVEYPHSGDPVSGISIIAGNVYRGTALPGLDGLFVFGDFQAEGELFVASPTDEGLWDTGVLPIATDDAGKLQQLRAFGRNNGELYVLSSGNDSGGLHRLAPASE